MENEKNQENNKEKKEYVFFVNKKEIQVSQEDLTGKGNIISGRIRR